MTYQNNFTLSEALLDQSFLEQLSASGLDALPDPMSSARMHWRFGPIGGPISH